jgi:hypothetical protein
MSVLDPLSQLANTYTFSCFHYSGIAAESLSSLAHGYDVAYAVEMRANKITKRW